MKLVSKILENLTEEIKNKLDFIAEMISDGCGVSKENTQLVFDELDAAGLIDIEAVKWWINELDSDEDFE